MFIYPKGSSSSPALAVLDERIAEIRSKLPELVISTRVAVKESRAKKNRDRKNIGIGITLGGFLLQIGGNLGDEEISIGDILNRVIGASLASASYAADRFNAVEDEDLSCANPRVVDGILSEYRVLLAPGDIIRLSGGYTPLEYHAIYMGIDLRNALSCVLNDGGSSRALNAAIDNLVDAVERKLTLLKTP